MGFIADNVNANPQTQNFNRGGVYMKDGTYLVRIHKAELRNVKDGAGRAYIPEFILLESSNPEMPVGMNASQYINFMGVPKAAFRDMALFLAAAFGHAEDVEWMKANLSPAVQERLACEGNVIGSLGLEMVLVCVTKPQVSDRNKVFTHYNWSSARNPQLLDEVLRMPLGAAVPAQAPQAPAVAVPPPPPPGAAFPPAGWFTNGVSVGSYHNGKVVLTEAALRAEIAAGRA